MPTRLQVRVEGREQLADCSGASELLPEQPDRLGIRYPVMEPEPEKAHERQAVLDLELSRVVRERVQGLEHQDLEHQDRVIRWAATPRSIGTGECPQQRAPEKLELDQLSKLDQRVSCLGKCPIPLIEIEEPRLPHHPRLRIAPTIRSRQDRKREVLRGVLSERRAAAGS